MPNEEAAKAVPAATVCWTFTTYVPMSPEPVPNAVMVVPGVTPAPVTDMPMASAPDSTSVTVSLAAAIWPVKVALPAAMAVPSDTFAGLGTRLPTPPSPASP